MHSNIRLALYLGYLYDKVTSLDQSMTALEEARERALHLLDDNSIQARRRNGTFPER